MKKETTAVAERNKAILFLVFAVILWSAGGLLILSVVSWPPLAIAGARSDRRLFVLFYIYLRDSARPGWNGRRCRSGRPLCYAGVVSLSSHRQ